MTHALQPYTPSSSPGARLMRDVFIFYSATLVFFAIGSITSLGLGWYVGLAAPSWLPPEIVIAAIWGTLFVTTVVSLSIFCDASESGTAPLRSTVLMYIGNAFLILLWNYLFFGAHLLLPALWAAVAVGFSILVLIWRVRPVSPVVAWLLLPYLAWVAYAIIVNYAVMRMN